MPEDMQRLVLGTAQLGMPYGIANTSGRPNPARAIAIVEAAWFHGISEFDTAQAYGDSERILGKAFAELGISDQARVVSKIDPAVDHSDSQAVRDAVSQSLERLGISRLYGVMVHDERHLDAMGQGLGDVLRSLREEGLIEHAGVSLYTPQKALDALSLDTVDLIQIPANLLDRRMEDAGVFAKVRSRGKQIAIRSVFLQGLLLMSADQLPSKVRMASDLLVRLQSIAKEYGFSPQHLSLGYVRERYPDAKVLVGAELPRQIVENCAYWSRLLSDGVLNRLHRAFDEIDERIVDPRFWKE